MSSDNLATTLTISVLTRHSTDCSKSADPQWPRGECPKSLYIYEVGKVRYVSAKTRCWEEAERVALSEREKRDPVKLELLKIAENEVAKEAAIQAKLKPLEAALEQWITGMKSAG